MTSTPFVELAYAGGGGFFVVRVDGEPTFCASRRDVAVDEARGLANALGCTVLDSTQTPEPMTGKERWRVNESPALKADGSAVNERVARAERRERSLSYLERNRLGVISADDVESWEISQDLEDSQLLPGNHFWFYAEAYATAAAGDSTDSWRQYNHWRYTTVLDNQFFRWELSAAGIRAAKQIGAGGSMRATSRALGVSTYAATKMFKALYPDAEKPPICECGKPVSHSGWCDVRLAASPARQAYVAKMREKKEHTARVLARLSRPVSQPPQR